MTDRIRAAIGVVYQPWSSTLPSRRGAKSFEARFRDVAETFDRLSGERYVHAIFPNAVEQGRVAALNILGRDMAYEGSDNMNSLKHLGLPIIAVRQAAGEELRVRRDDVLRKVYVENDRIVGFRLTGDVSVAGILRSLMNRRVDVGPLKDTLLEPHFGMGVISEMALAARFPM